MGDRYDTVLSRFTDLLVRLSWTWPSSELDFVRDEVEHREFGDALENLAALAIRSGRVLDEDSIADIEVLAREMQISTSPVFRELRERRDGRLSAD